MKLTKVMKKKCMVPGSWSLVLGAWCLVLGASTAWAKPKILDGSVIGLWDFNAGSDSADVSGYGGGVVALGSYGAVKTSGSFDGSGYLNISTAGKSISATIGEFAPAFNNQTSPYFTITTRFRSGNSRMATAGTTEVKAIFNDTENWHFVAKRYQPDRITNSGYANMIVLDPLYNDGNNWINADGSTNNDRPQELAGKTADAPLSISGKSVTIGGAIKFTVKVIWETTETVNYVGDLDEVMIINRMMTKRELARLYKTGETYIYPVNTPTFSGADCWSSSEWEFNPVPGALVGVAYIVDNGKTMTQNATATFGGDVSKKISLTLGRLAELTYPEGTTTKTVTTVGNFSQGVGSAITFYDLRLNDGTYAAGGTSLTTTLLDVDAPPSKPFALSAAGDFALNVGEDTTGSGVLAKTGAGKLTVSKWAGTAKLRMTEGSIKTPRLDGYTDGKVLVNTTTPVVFTGTDVLEKPMQIEVENPPSVAGTYTLMTVPSGSAKSNFDNSAQSYGNLVGTLSVDGTALKLTLKLPFPDADKGEVPVLIGQ